ncbi:GntR family transcriptional regulator [Sinorhizobium sp. BG8]|uniref:GntR family transcriptional regulator n=1 Tax=Sinorhizobium sp. BG8 TaxID=2613773 RepID=UPI00193CCBC7|nr:GntR family transcriptional regulator [Sinorhizobium sp. BG8]QRM55297.1 GntR family transcriptional regulator [Sinorhizobium sp. BG8]
MPLKADRAINLGAAPSASEVIMKFVRDSIMDGTLDEGEPIRQDDVARLFNVSKIPVREALKRLEAEGLVAFHRNRGAVVTSLSEPEIVEVFEVRALLEAGAIRYSIPHMTEETFQKAQTYCDAFANENNAAHWAELNWKFHSCLYEDAKRPYLLNTIRSVNDRIERYLRVQLSLSKGHHTADVEHRQILALCRKRDVDGAASLVHDHIMGACSSLLQHLPRTSKAKG